MTERKRRLTAITVSHDRFQKQMCSSKWRIINCQIDEYACARARARERGEREVEKERTRGNFAVDEPRDHAGLHQNCPARPLKVN